MAHRHASLAAELSLIILASVFLCSCGGGGSTQVTPPGPPPTPTPLIPLDNLTVHHLLYDAGRQRLYASVPDSAGSHGNSIAVIDPASKTVQAFIPVGVDPNLLALSSDAQFLYTSTAGDTSIQRVNLNTRAAELQFPLGSDPFHGAWKAAGLAVVPGAPHAVAVALQDPVYSGPLGVAIYDDGVQRPLMVDGLYGSDSIVFSDSPSVLYGYRNQWDANIRIMAIDASGITLVATAANLVLDPATIAFSYGRIYASNGVSIDVSTLEPAGVFGAGTSRGFAIDDAAGLAYFLADNASGVPTIFGFHLDKFTLLGTHALPLASGQGRELVRCGPAGFALATPTGVLITDTTLLPVPAIGPGAADLRVHHLVYDTGRQKIYATVPGTVGALGNTVTVIDPFSQTIESSVFVGSEPGPMSLSPDGQSLFVGLDGSRRVAKLDLGSQNVAYSFPAGMTTPAYGWLYAGHLSASPADPDIVAVSRRVVAMYPGLEGVALFDHGVQLPGTTVFPWQGVDSVAFDSTGTHLFGLGGAFFRMQVDASGIASNEHFALIPATSPEIVYDSGKVYSVQGMVVDPGPPALVGTFAGMDAATAVVPDHAASQALFLTYTPYETPPNAVVRFDTTTYALIGALPVAGASGRGHDLVRFGPSGVAFATDDGHILFADLANTPPPDPPLGQLPANRLVYDANRQRIYASIPGSAGVRGNTITIIDPAQGAIEASIPVGSEPGPLALSSDGLYLYVGLGGTPAVQRLNLDTGQVDLEFPLGADPFLGPTFAESMAIVPDDSHTVVVARIYHGDISPRNAGVVAYHDGVALPLSIPVVGSDIDELAFSASSSLLYGYGNLVSPQRFYRLQVDANGVAILDSTPGLINDFLARIVFDGGLVYASTGTAVDPVTRTVAGTFPGMQGGLAVAPDAASSKVYFLANDIGIGYLSVRGFDRSTYQMTGGITLPTPAQGHDIVHWDPQGLAIATDRGIVLLNGNLP